MIPKNSSSQSVLRNTTLHVQRTRTTFPPIPKWCMSLVGHPEHSWNVPTISHQPTKKNLPLKLDNDPIVCVRSFFSEAAKSELQSFTHTRSDNSGGWTHSFGQPEVVGVILFGQRSAHTHGFRVSVSFFFYGVLLYWTQTKTIPWRWIYRYFGRRNGRITRDFFFLPKDSREI